MGCYWYTVCCYFYPLKMRYVDINRECKNQTYHDVMIDLIHHFLSLHLKQIEVQHQKIQVLVLVKILEMLMILWQKMIVDNKMLHSFVIPAQNPKKYEFFKSPAPG